MDETQTAAPEAPAAAPVTGEATPFPVSVQTSAGPIVGGLVALLLAGTCLFIAQVQAASSYDGSGGTGWIVIGGLLALSGAIVLLVGLHTLASHVDNLARGQRGLPLK